MGKVVGQRVRGAALLGMLILVPLTAMVGNSSIPSLIPAWILEGPCGAKWASAREATVSSPEEDSLGKAALKSPDLRQNGQDFPQLPSYEVLPNRPKETISSLPPPKRGCAFPSPDPQKETFLPEEMGKTNFVLPSEPRVGANGPSNCGSIPLPDGQVASAVVFCSEQKDCQQLGRYLEKLGATEYRLESWGTRGEMYHFQCRVKVLPEGTLWTRHFEATASSACQAMQEVLAEVVRWREEMGQPGLSP